SAMSASIAVSAASASAPSVSTRMREPFPAASIITPMMLLALTRRPLRDSQTSQEKSPAERVSFAEARACSPSLLMISTSACGMRSLRLDVDHAIDAAADGLANHRGERFLAVGDDAYQHGQADACDGF